MNTPANTARRGYILLAHGSRDPQWRAGLEAVAETLTQRHVPCCCAYLELCEPTLDQAADALLQAGCEALRVVPMLLGLGQHARRDIPDRVAALRARLPHMVITLTPALCERDGFAQCLANFVLGD